MGTLVSFPGLGIEVTVNRVAFTLFGFDIYWYGLLIAAGAGLAMIYALRRMKYFGIDVDRALDVILVSTVAAIAGARFYYVIFASPGEFSSLSDLFDIRKGGLAFYGGVIGAFSAAVVTAKIRKVKVLPVLDLASIGFLIGQGIGRWGNFVNQEAFGVNTTAPWGMTSSVVTNYLTYNQGALEAGGMTVDPAMPVHPTFLYESLWCLLGFLLLNAYFKRRKFDGELVLLYLGWNGIGRAMIEGLRTDSLYVGQFRVSQLLAVFGVALSVLAVTSLRSRIKKAANPEEFLPYGMTDRCVRDMQELEREREEAFLRRRAKRLGIPFEPVKAESPVPKTVLTPVWGASFALVMTAEKPVRPRRKASGGSRAKKVSAAPGAEKSAAKKRAAKKPAAKVSKKKAEQGAGELAGE